MHQNLGFLFAAFALTWAAFFVYLFYVQRLLAETGRRLRALERVSSARRAAPRRPDPDTNGAD